MELIVEIVSRNNKVLSMHKVSGETIKLGRAYDNDVVLQEEHVSPYHAELRLNEGKLELLDSESTNGIKDRHNIKLEPIVLVSSGDVFVLGKVFVRILTCDHAVEPAKKINFIEDLARAANQWYWAVSAVAIYYTILLTNKYYDTYQEVVWSKLAVKSVVEALLMFIVPLILAICARVFKKDVKFYTITSFSYIISIAWLILTAFGSVLLFNWGDSIAISIGAELIDYALLLLFICGSFYLASNMNLTKIVSISGGLVFCIATLFYINDKGDDKVNLYPRMASKILPNGWLIASPVTTARFKKHTADLYDKSTKEAERRNAEADE